MPTSDSQLGGQITVYSLTPDGLILTGITRGTPPQASGEFAAGASLFDITNGDLFVNKGTSASPSWASSTKIKNGTPVNGAAAVAATGTWTPSGSASDGNTFTIGDDTYTWKSTLTGAAYEVFIDPDGPTAVANAVAAINGAAGEGTKYGTGTVASTYVTAALDGTAIDLTAITAGTAGNSIATTTTGGNAAFGSATLTGGTDAVAGTSGSAGEIRFDSDYVYLATDSGVWKRASLSSF